MDYRFALLDTLNAYFPEGKQVFINNNIDDVIKEIMRADQSIPPNYELCKKVITYLTPKSVKYIYNTYLKNMSKKLIKKLTNDHMIMLIRPTDINSLSVLLAYSKRYIFSYDSLEHVLMLIKTSKVYTMDMINILLEISTDEVYSTDENYSTNKDYSIDDILLELTIKCCQNISDFNINSIIPVAGVQKHTASKIMEAIITFTGVHIDNEAIDHLHQCGIHVQEPERFFN